MHWPSNEISGPGYPATDVGEFLQSETCGPWDRPGLGSLRGGQAARRGSLE